MTQTSPLSQNRLSAKTHFPFFRWADRTLTGRWARPIPWTSILTSAFSDRRSFVTNETPFFRTTLYHLFHHPLRPMLPSTIDTFLLPAISNAGQLSCQLTGGGYTNERRPRCAVFSQTARGPCLGGPMRVAQLLVSILFFLSHLFFQQSASVVP